MVAPAGRATQDPSARRSDPKHQAVIRVIRDEAVAVDLATSAIPPIRLPRSRQGLPGRPRANQLIDLARRDGTREHEALRERASHVAEHLRLAGGLHAFRDWLEPEVSNERDDRAHELRVLG